MRKKRRPLTARERLLAAARQVSRDYNVTDTRSFLQNEVPKRKAQFEQTIQAFNQKYNTTLGANVNGQYGNLGYNQVIRAGEKAGASVEEINALLGGITFYRGTYALSPQGKKYIASEESDKPIPPRVKDEPVVDVTKVPSAASAHVDPDALVAMGDRGLPDPKDLTGSDMALFVPGSEKLVFATPEGIKERDEAFFNLYGRVPQGYEINKYGTLDVVSLPNRFGLDRQAKRLGGGKKDAQAEIAKWNAAHGYTEPVSASSHEQYAERPWIKKAQNVKPQDYEDWLIQQAGSTFNRRTDTARRGRPIDQEEMGANLMTGSDALRNTLTADQYTDPEMAEIESEMARSVIERSGWEPRTKRKKQPWEDMYPWTPFF